MDCLDCKSRTADIGDVIFYYKGPTDVFMCLAPESKEKCLGSTLVRGEADPRNPRKVPVLCRYCQKTIGHELQFGPSNYPLVAFGTDKVVLCGQTRKKKETWSKVYASEKYVSVSRRNTDDFFKNESCSYIDKNKFSAPSYGKVVMPSLEIIGEDGVVPRDFDYSNLLKQKRPRSYQVECFYEALQSDTIIVLPTGAGKTLIACMLLVRMNLLNPERMGLLIVEKVPLVFQQNKVIQKETRLRSLGICGENKTLKKIEDLHRDHFDVLVITAGSLDYLLESKVLFLEMFSCVIFDEAHHCTGNHKFAVILKKLFDLPSSLRPKLLGLTASPFPAKSYEEAEKNLWKMKEVFKSERIFRPSEKASCKPPFFSFFSYTTEQTAFIADILSTYNSTLEKICQFKGVNDMLNTNDLDLKSYKDMSTVSQMKGQANALLDILRNGESIEATKAGKYLHCLLEAHAINDALGVKSAAAYLSEKDGEQDLTLFEKYWTSKEVSPRMEILRNILQKHLDGPDGMNIKILVFVKTRTVANLVLGNLKESFPHLCPDKVIGHGGIDGQIWSGQQDNVIANFHSGKCKLLVCTSVLEEGIDVQECNLVVRYDGVQSAIQFIQSRGRARATNGQFHVICTQFEEAQVRGVENQERILNLVLDDHAQKLNLPSPITKKLLQSEPLGNGIDAGNNLQSLEDDDKNSGVEFFLPFQEMDDLDLEKMLTEELANWSLVVERIDIKRTDARRKFGCHQMFDKDDISVLCWLTTDFDESALQRYQELAVTWEYEDKNRKVLYSRAHITDTDQKLLMWNLESLSAGNFESRTTFHRRYCLERPNMRLNFSNTGQVLTVEFDDFMFCTSLLKTSFIGFIICSWEENFCHFFMPLESIPVLKRITNRLKKEYSRVTKHPLLEFLCKYPVLVLKIRTDGTDWKELRRILGDHKIMPLPALDTRIKIKVQDSLEDTVSLDKVDISSQEDYHYCRELLSLEWQVLIKATDLLIHASTAELCCWLNKIRLAYSEANYSMAHKFATAVKMSNRNNISYWTPFEQLVNHQLRKLQALPEDLDISPLFHDNQSKSQLLFNIKRVIVTPTRILFQPDIPRASSRLLRMLCEQHEIISVAFRDENLDKIETGEDVLNRVRNIFVEGLSILGRRFSYLISSGSQVREHQAFFVLGSTKEAQELRNLLIPDVSFFNGSTAKYLSRLGLFATADYPTIETEDDWFFEIPDEKAVDGRLVTDGAGFIKQSLAEEMFEKTKFQLPSAFQFRCKGLKGVLVILPDLHEIWSDKPANCRILFRDSQKKFESDHNTMCIVKPAKVHDVYLNREIITLLESLYLHQSREEFWNFPELLMKKQELYLEDIGASLCQAEEAVAELQKHMDSSYVNQVAASFDIVNETFHFRLLRNCHRFAIYDLYRKANLRVSNGCLAMGIPDFSKQLQTDQVFLQIQQEGSLESQIIEGLVMIYRNPCLHPGDVRLVQAVNVPELKSFKNVLVMPAYKAKYSLADSCSGGDLDGDQFSVIWDNDLMPPIKLVQSPCDYANLGGMKAKEANDVTDPEQMAEFFVDNIKNDALGRVANMHVALSDMLPKGAMEPLAKSMAKSQAIAVDYPKTGVLTEVPVEAKSRVLEKGYPDFLRRSTGKTYFSKRVLGEMYRDSKSYLFSHDMEEIENRKIPLDRSLIVDGVDDVIDKASVIYDSYCAEMSNIMRQFSLSHEEEVVLGRAVMWHPLLDSNRNKSSKYLTQSYKDLVDKYRRLFTTTNTHCNSKVWASAWYKVAYSQNPTSGRKPFLSFPWIAFDTLSTFKEEMLSFESHAVIHAEIGSTALESYILEHGDDEDKNQHLRTLKEKEWCYKKVVEKIMDHSSKPLYCYMYGSTSLFLNDHDSDIDICASMHGKFTSSVRDTSKDNPAEKLTFLESVVCPAVDTIFDSMQKNLTSEVPVIKGRMGDQKVDICCNMVGLQKTWLIWSMYESAPENIILFTLLVQWGRFYGLIRHRDYDGPLETTHLYALIFHFLNLDASCDYMNLYQNMPLYDMRKKLLNYSKESKEQKLGQLICLFFQKGSNQMDDLNICWPTVPAVESNIAGNELKQFRRACRQSLHYLLATRSVPEMMKNAEDCNSSQREFTKKLPLSLSINLSKGKTYWERLLSKEFDVKVELREEPGEDRLVLQTEGRRKAVSDLRYYLAEMARTNRIATRCLSRSRASRYFMMNSTLFMMQDVPHAEDVRVNLRDSRGMHQPAHIAHQRSNLKTKDKHKYHISAGDWMDNVASPCFEEKLTEQCLQIPEQDRFLKTLEVTARFGNCYMIDAETRLEPTRTTFSLEELRTEFEKNKAMRKEAERGVLPSCLKKKSEDKQFPMTTLKPGRGERRMETNQNPRQTKHQAPQGISMSFSPGIFNINMLDKEVHQPLMMSECAKLYRSVILDCGYTRLHDMTLERMIPSEHWLFSMQLSAGYEVLLLLDDKFQFLKLCERHLSFAHVTFFQGSESVQEDESKDDYFIPEHDIRLLVQSAATIKDKNDLFKIVFPDGDVNNVPFELGEQRMPRFKDTTSNHLKRSVSICKQALTIEYYSKDGVVASIVGGKIFYGQHLEEHRHYCDISLFYNPQGVIDGRREPEIMKQLANTAVKSAKEISLKLSEKIKEFNKEKRKMSAY